MLCIISLWCLLSCGLEDFYYIDYIDDAYISNPNYESAVIQRLPSSSNEGYDKYFSNFIIFYRIYLSNTNLSAASPNISDFSSINSTMSTNYSNFFSSTDKTSTSFSSENLENLFYSRDFYKLALADTNTGLPINIDNVLSNSSLGSPLEFIFSGTTGDIPMLRVANNYYFLLRAASKPDLNFTTMPKEHRYFFNEDALRDIKYLNKETPSEYNADVARLQGQANDVTQYAYVIMYIAAQGITGDIPPKPIYSQPSFIGVFWLPKLN